MNSLQHTTYPIMMEVAGDTAMWTRPDSGDSPSSYPAPTYSAVKALFESVLWGPAVTIVPRKVEICAPIQYHSYVTNYGGPLRKQDSIKKGNNYQLYATVLVDVCYRLYADVMLNPAKEHLLQRLSHGIHLRPRLDMPIKRFSTADSSLGNPIQRYH